MDKKHRKNSEYGKGPHLILIGFMGSGKTSIGRGLSYKLRRAFHDTDRMIEEKEGMSISEIFAAKGERAFRQMETEVLREIRDDRIGRIYSLGGGTPVLMENQPLIKKCGTVCYLRITAGEVYERLKGDTSRPLLQCDDPLARISDLIAKRSPAYERCADFVVDTGSISREMVMDAVLDNLRALGWDIPVIEKTETEKNEDTCDQRTEP